jgi:hypothetical protein
MIAIGQIQLMLALAFVATAGPSSSAPDPSSTDTANSQPFPPAEARRAPGTKDSPEVRDLLRQRQELAKAELDRARKLLFDPNFRADAWSALAERLLVVEIDAAETPAERTAAYREFRDNLKLMEDQLKGVSEPSRGQGYFQYGQKLWIRARRLQAEVTLLQSELTKGDSPPDEDPPAVRQALLAWRDVVHEWAQMWLGSRIVLIPPFAREIATTTLSADLASAKGQAERIAAYKAYRDRLLAVERDTRSEVEKRRYSAFDYLRIKEMRCDADVHLGRLQAGNDKSAAKDAPEVRAALDDWREAISFEADVIHKRFDAGKTPPEEMLVVSESSLRAELAAARGPDERVAAYKKYLGQLKEAEASVKSRSTDRPGAKEEAARVIFSRAAAELTLLQMSDPAAAKTSTQAKALLGEQRDALRAELAQRMAEWAAGQGDFQALQESAGHLLLAELGTAGSPAERLAAYQAHVNRMRTAEDNARAVVIDAKKGTDAWLWWTRSARLEAEVWLLRARKSLSSASAPQQSSSH